MVDLSCDDSTSIGTPVPEKGSSERSSEGCNSRDVRPGTVSVSALDGFLLSTPGEVVSGIQAKIKQLSNFRRNRPAVSQKALAGRFFIQEIIMSVIANYCGTILLLRQLVKEGYCTKNEATRIAALIARQTGADIKLPIC